MLKICVRALSEPIKCLYDLVPFLNRGHKIPKTVYYICSNLGRSGGPTGLRFISHDFCTTCPGLW
ncbi:hypothetical protein KSS87_008428 [Heliosperma pusillum]|nr:hypothetical protein KSS87_008428 [Heliosperma pusillum]